MLSISKCKKILGQVLEERQIKEIRDSLYKIAEILIDEYLKKKNKKEVNENT